MPTSDASSSEKTPNKIHIWKKKSHPKKKTKPCRWLSSQTEPPRHAAAPRLAPSGPAFARGVPSGSTAPAPAPAPAPAATSRSPGGPGEASPPPPEPLGPGRGAAEPSPAAGSRRAEPSRAPGPLPTPPRPVPGAGPRLGAPPRPGSAPAPPWLGSARLGWARSPGPRAGGGASAGGGRPLPPAALRAGPGAAPRPRGLGACRPGPASGLVPPPPFSPGHPPKLGFKAAKCGPEAWPVLRGVLSGLNEESSVVGIAFWGKSLGFQEVSAIRCFASEMFCQQHWQMYQGIRSPRCPQAA